MSNIYYNYSGSFIPGTLARAEAIAAEYTLVQKGFDKISIQGIDTGTANHYAFTTPGYPVAAYQDGNNVQFKALNTNTGASDVNINGIGIVPLTRFNGAALLAGDVSAGSWYTAVYQVAFGAFTIVSPAAYTTFAGTISGAAPANKVGLTAAGGSATSAIPIDATLAIDQAIIPTWTGLHTFNGKVVVGAPASGVGLTVTGVAGASAAQFLTTGVQIGSPTGGDKGSGTLNVASGLYVNGTLVASGAIVTSITGTANQIAASASTGAVTLSMPQNVSIPTPASGTALTVTDAGNVSGTNAGFKVQSLNTTVSTSYSWDNINTNAGTWTVQTSGTQRLVLGSAGNVTVNAPTSGVALNISAVAGASSYGIQTISPATASNSFGLRIQAGTNSSDFSLVVANAAAGNQLLINGAGNVTVNAPSSGTALTLAAVSNGNLGIFTAGATAGQSLGIVIKSGTNSSDYSLVLQNQAGSVNQWFFGGDGGAYTNGLSTQGAGTLNVSGLYVSGNPVYAGIPQNSQGGSYTCVLADANKHIYSFGAGTITLPANASVAYPIGTAITIINGSGGNISVAITSDTLRLANSASTGTRTLANNAVTTAIKISATVWYISGAGIT